VSQAEASPPGAGDAVEDHGHDRLVSLYGICTICAVDVAKAALGDRTGPARPGPTGWHARARRAVAELAATRDEFTSDDVWAMIPRPPDPRQLGPILMEAADQGLIVRTDRTINSAGAFNHSRPVRVWETAQRHLL